MPTIAPPQVVRGAARIPLQYGLFSVLTFRTDSDRWENGVQWETLTCEPVGGIGMADCDVEEILGLPKEVGKLSTDLGEASSFTVYGHHTCSPIGNTWDWAQVQANQHLLLREEARVEQALWTGDLGNTPNFGGANGYPALLSVAVDDPTALWQVVAALEQVIAEDYGSQGILHMSRAVATRLAKEGDLRFVGGRIFTPLGTPVVAGTGYGSDKIVVTPPLFGYRSEIITSSDRPYDLLDRENNDLYAIAERTYVIGFDPCGASEASLETTPEEEA